MTTIVSSNIDAIADMFKRGIASCDDGAALYKQICDFLEEKGLSKADAGRATCAGFAFYGTRTNYNSAGLLMIINHGLQLGKT